MKHSTIDECRIIDLRKISDPRGNLTPIEGGGDIPFDIKRIYYLYDVPSGESRGAHAHKELQQLIIAANGSFTPVEMGARSSGFICSHTVSAASGHDYLRDYVDMLHGGKIQPGNYLNGPMASMWYGYDIPANSDSVKETDITKFLDPRIEVLFEKHDGLKASVHYGEYIDDGDRDKFGYAILTAPRDVLTIESIEQSEQRFLDEFLGIRRICKNHK